MSATIGTREARTICLSAAVDSACWPLPFPGVEPPSTYPRRFGFQQPAEPRKYGGGNVQTQLPGVRTDRRRAHGDGMKPAKHAWSAALEQLAARPPFAICSQECAQPSYS